MRAEPRVLPGPFTGLSNKLIATIIAVILAVEIAVYLPLAAGFRVNWLEDRLQVGLVAAVVLEAAPDAMAIPSALTDRLLSSAGATAIAYRRAGMSQLIAREGAPLPAEAVVADLRAAEPLALIGGMLDTLFAGNGRTLRILGTAEGEPDSLVEVLMPEAPLRQDLLAYSRNILIVSLLVASLTAAVLYVFVSRALIGPIRRMTGNMLAYRRAPENASLVLVPSRRRDEIGVLERELTAMETDIHTMLRQQRHMADLGMAVAKINHDLRNTLTSAQLLSDQVANLDDPKVQRLAPRLVHTLDKAIGFAQSVLDYGRESGTPPRPVPTDLRALVEEALFDAGLVAHPAIAVTDAVPEAVVVEVDPNQLARVFVNLLKNAREALDAAGAKIEAPAVRIGYAEDGEWLSVEVADNGPGLPPRARDNLFVAFSGSARAGGTGLGLAIAKELAEAHGGSLAFLDAGPGTRFLVRLPRSLRLR